MKATKIYNYNIYTPIVFSFRRRVTATVEALAYLWLLCWRMRVRSPHIKYVFIGHTNVCCCLGVFAHVLCVFPCGVNPSKLLSIKRLLLF